MLDIKNKSLEELKGITHTVVADSAFNSPISLDQERVQVGDTFHQSVYLELNSTKELVELRSNLLNALGAPANTETPAFPHAPLHYGEGHQDDKHRLVTQMTQLDTRGDGAVVVKGLNSRLDLTQLWIVDIIADDPASWVVLHEEALVTGFTQQPAISPPSPPVSPGSSPTTSPTGSSDSSTAFSVGSPVDPSTRTPKQPVTTPPASASE